MGTESTGLLLPHTSLLSHNIPIQPASSTAEHPAPSLWKGEHSVHWSSAVMGWACSKHSIFRHCRTRAFRASLSELTTDPTDKQHYQRVFSVLKDSKWSQTGESQPSIQQETLKHKRWERQQQFDNERQNDNILLSFSCPIKSCWVFAVHSTEKELATPSRCQVSYYAHKTGSEDTEILIRYKIS